MPVPGGPLTRYGLSLQLHAEEHVVFAPAHDIGDRAHGVARWDITFWNRCLLQEYFYLFPQLCFPSCLDVYAMDTRVCSIAGAYSEIAERVTSVTFWLVVPA